VTSKDGRYAYTANAGSGTISGFIVGHDGSLSLVGRDGTFLHVLVDGKHTVGTFRIGRDGGLTWVGAAGDLPAGDVGLAAS
jgi:hypothetical protein